LQVSTVGSFSYGWRQDSPVRGAGYEPSACQESQEVLLGKLSLSLLLLSACLFFLSTFSSIAL